MQCERQCLVSAYRAYSNSIRCTTRSRQRVYEIKDDYDAKNGAPSAAAPKVFEKWFYVNKTTSEMSGEMMSAVTLGEDAPVQEPGS